MSKSIEVLGSPVEPEGVRWKSHGRWRHAALQSLAGLFLATSPILAESVEAPVDPPRWSPSMSLGMLAHVQDVSGRGASTFPAREFFEPIVEDDPLIVVPVVPVGVQLKGPGIAVGGRSVRPFLHGRVQVPFDQDRTVLRQGTVPNPVLIPDDLSSMQNASRLSGQGTILVATVDVLGQFGAGVALDVELFDQPFIAAVSLDYLAEQFSLDGRVVFVRGTGPGEIAPYTIQRLKQLDHALVHYFGPRFELETFAAEKGPFRVSVFAEFGSFFALGDRSKSFVARDATDSARFDFEVDPWLIQAGVGLRLTWAGN